MYMYVYHITERVTCTTYLTIRLACNLHFVPKQFSLLTQVWLLTTLFGDFKCAVEFLIIVVVWDEICIKVKLLPCKLHESCAISIHNYIH